MKRKWLALVVLACIGSLLVGYNTRPGRKGGAIGGMKLEEAHDSAAGVFFIDKGSGGSTLTPTSTSANRAEFEYWSITNNSDVAIDVALQGEWTPTFNGTLDWSTIFENHIIVPLQIGESFRMDQPGMRFTFTGCALLTDITGGYVLVMGWNP